MEGRLERQAVSEFLQVVEGEVVAFPAHVVVDHQAVVVGEVESLFHLEVVAGAVVYVHRQGVEVVVVAEQCD